MLDHVLPKGSQKMDSIRWREVFLWNLPVDDLLKANYDNLKRIFDMLKTPRTRFVSLKSMNEYIAELPLRVSLDTVTQAYAFSKMQFVEELEQIERYN